METLTTISQDGQFHILPWVELLLIKLTRLHLRMQSMTSNMVFARILYSKLPNVHPIPLLREMMITAYAYLTVELRVVAVFSENRTRNRRTIE